ncbi:AAA family ATPase [Solwaraspora sp. WMMD1047]|uniref:ATP-binding protein n=1 Tax=Solwaraspora sp. WMMD1047 TaxID=3016102 RepID=UPI002415B547|nr:AAA family ATPase [Solwaraspora sp. WMMD1047]MDG4829334.1 AAA family ATPase [Solwaraspora sp. WMMD1047]
MRDDPQNSTVDQLIQEHLDHADLPETAENLIIAALLGDDDFAAMLGGTAPRRPEPTIDALEQTRPIGTYLAGIEVTGFRGIGPTATLGLIPGPGLTIVTGRNGSGKSSFAEAAEFALTGDNKRWTGRTSVWRDGWRNLHTTGDSRIKVRLGVEGQRGGATVECHWAGGAGLSEGITHLQAVGGQRQSVADLGWKQPLELYRPFLSYSELGGLIGGKPSEMHDSLQLILGLGRLVEVETMLKTARREMDQRRKRSAESRPALLAALAEHPDPRARLAEQALAGRAADLERLGALVTSEDADDDSAVVPLRQLDVLHLPGREEVAEVVDRLRAALARIDELAGTPAGEARALAALLRDALRHRADHPDQPCPVCGGRTLDQEWAAEAQDRMDGLTRLAEDLDAAHRAEREARHALRALVPAEPKALAADLSAEHVHTGEARTAWQRWDELLAVPASARVVESAVGGFETLLGKVTVVQAASRDALNRRRQVWQPIADHLRTWIDTERDSRRAATNLTALKAAISELQKIGATIRNDKLAPIAAEATGIWNTLRQDSNVTLGGIKLAGTGTSRRVDLDVQVDGVPGAALGVMSQGELHSLALALFLPRATMPASPFRFLVIDDPVQSMDPAKVYGLAQVLADVAKDRQVIVFTHDDRLPAAVRHLELDARILAVDRHARSQVTVKGDGDPAERYLTDASAIAKDDGMADDVRRTITCNLLRYAIEYTCQEKIRIRGYQAGAAVVNTENAIGEAVRLRQILALALLGDRTREGEVNARLEKLDRAAPRLVRTVNAGSHGDAATDLPTLIRDARRLVKELSAA